MVEYPWRNKRLLYEEYVENERSMADIADMLDTTPNTIKNWLDKHDIPTRTIQEANTDGDVSKLSNEVWLEEEYIDKERSTYDIAEELGLSAHTVQKWLKRHEIDLRASYTEQTEADKSLLRDEEFLREKYTEDEFTLYDLAEMIDTYPQTVRYWFLKHGIDTDDRAGYEGENNPRWTDSPNVDSYYGEQWTEIRREVIVRDQARCVKCGMTEQEQLDSLGYELSVHHIVPRREFISGGELDYEKANRNENLITVCHSCHNKLEGIPIDARHLTSD